MYLIVGLGNPEEEYSNTRHNMGFDVINILSKEYDIPVTKTKFKGLYGTGMIENEKVILLKPQTYMNLSGESVIQFRDFYKIKDKNIIIVYDDMDIDAGTMKIRQKGGTGSHNGMKSVVQQLETQDFPRIRVGIGKPEFKHDMINYVIGKVQKEEYDILKKGIEKAAKALPEIIKIGIDNAMNKFN